MATLSLTFSQLSAPIKRVHIGSNVVGGALSVSNTVCPSTILHMVQVPSGVTLTDFWLRLQTGGNNQSVKIGTSFTHSGILAVTTQSASFSISASNQLLVPQPYMQVIKPGVNWYTTATDLMPVHISLSDDAIPATIWIQSRVSVGCSASAFFTFLLWYTADGLKGHTEINK